MGFLDVHGERTGGYFYTCTFFRQNISYIYIYISRLTTSLILITNTIDVGDRPHSLLPDEINSENIQSNMMTIKSKQVFIYIKSKYSFSIRIFFLDFNRFYK
jgi:hypothetical protein